jgi:hypothetical protein
MVCSVTLRFKTREQRDFFMGQLSDGWGENEVRLKWRGMKSNVSLDAVDVVDVDPTGTELWELHRERAAWIRTQARLAAPPDTEGKKR